MIDRTGAPIVGRAVSNGVEVTNTDGTGAWELPHGGPFVWVHRGDGFDCAEWYRRADAEPVTFRMSPSAGPRHRFGHITDLHVDASAGAFGLSEGDCTADRLLAVLTELRDVFGCDAVLATGDLTNRGADDDFVELRAALDRSPLPVFHMPGNHDHYGHYFAPDEPAEPAGRAGTGSGDRYERHLGPRWWSMTEAGLRIVAIDWHSWHDGLDDDVQRAWLAADLAHAPAGTGVLVMSHDLMARDFYDHLASVAPHVSIVGSLSGHWHTARAERVDGQLHLNTGNPMFGSWDWSPPHVRVLDLDGSLPADRRMSVRTRALAVGAQHRTATFSSAAVPGDASPADRVVWRRSLGGVAHLGGPVPVGAGDAVVVGWRDEDRLIGGVTAVDTSDGAERWTTELGGAVVARVAVAGADLAAVTIDGRVALLDVDSGALRWSTSVASTRGLWMCARPLVADDIVVVGSGPVFAGLDRHDGRERWRRTDLGSHEMYPSYGDGLVDGDRVVLGMPSVEPSLYCLDAATGDTVWSVTAGTPGGSPAGSLVWGDGGRLYGLTHRPELFCVDAATGDERFRVRVDGHATWAAPLVVGEGVVVVTADARMACFDPDDGALRWQVELPAGDAAAFAPYRRPGRSAIAGPVNLGGACRVGTTDGTVWTIDAASGGVEPLVLLPAPVTAGIAVAAGGLVVPTADGSLWRLDPGRR